MNVIRQALAFSTLYQVECIGPDGKQKWKEEFNNLVVDEGLNDNLDKYFKGSSYNAAHYVGLLDATPTVAAGDVMNSHVGWTEITAYSEAARPDLTLGSVANKSVNNSAAKASYSINADGTVIGGAFTATNATKGGTSGLLYGAGAFSGGNKTVDDGDTLNVTVTLTAAATV